ncbi:metallophosphoesterase [Methylocystis sp. JAN1]|uniref:metallophosphoesterase n=1 Tax=Methylocystis sp. JAN1 TaxID=3397211 RepID=UPI003FA2E791
MKRMLSGALLAALSFSCSPACADQDIFGDDGEKRIVIAAFGDWPYNTNLLNAAPRLIESVNSDKEVSLVLHVGDIHSGSMPCTSAGILPTLPDANPGWNQAIFANFQKFQAPFVYTPGDNEWTDCHKTKELKSGDPLKELANVRSLFFSRPGHTLGLTDKLVYSQAQHFDPQHPTDADYVENVLWRDGKTVFVTLNMPGSNNDTLAWTNGFENVPAHSAEIAHRTDADIRWLQAAFQYAAQAHAKAMVIGLQADMWDPAALLPGGDGLSAYTPFVRELARLAIAFGRPVLLINGDSHLYGADQPLADPMSATGQIHGAPPVPNLTRITVEGSTNVPAEWLRLTIDTRTPKVFGWTNVVYCADPTAGCP